MTSQLPANLLRLFAPRPPLEYLGPVGKDPVTRKKPRYDGLASVLEACKNHDTDYQPTETLEEKRLKRVIVFNLVRGKEGSNQKVDPRYKTILGSRSN